MIDRRIMANSRFMNLYVETVTEECMLVLVDYFDNNGIRILNVTRKDENKWYKSDTCAVIELDFGKRRVHKPVLEDIRKMDRIRYLEEI